MFHLGGEQVKKSFFFIKKFAIWDARKFVDKSEAYLQQSRPGIDGKCSQGLLPCLPEKSVDPEIQNCVDDMKKCPITDIQILTKKEAKPYRKSGEYT